MLLQFAVIYPRSPHLVSDTFVVNPPACIFIPHQFINNKYALMHLSDPAEIFISNQDQATFWILYSVLGICTQLKNIVERLNFLYPNSHCFKVIRGLTAGYRIQFSIPVEYS
jgi:hypothetical protein